MEIISSMRSDVGSRLEPSSLFPSATPLQIQTGRPILCVIVDAEEEFHWNLPVSAQNNATASIQSQGRAHDIFSCYGVIPTYLVTYPVASNAKSVGILRDYLSSGLCEVGAQLHPWVTPPYQREGGEHLTFPGNLAPAIEREKLHRLTETIRNSFSVQPTAYKAGRYGFGPFTASMLEEEGFCVDTSLIPRTNYSQSGGPNFSRFDYGPFWFGSKRQILELPVTRALVGSLAKSAPWLYALAERRGLRRFRSPGILARGHALERITLSPEGSDLPAMQRLTKSLLERGVRVLTLSYHSPSLEPGNTPYVRNHNDLRIFLDRISGYLSYFCDELNGTVMPVRELYSRLLTNTVSDNTKPIPSNPDPAHDGANRCLVVANTFPPVHGGSAIVYDSLARFGAGRVSVLAPQEDYRDGLPIQGWREFDRKVPYPIHRLRLLRTRFLPNDAGIIRRIGGIVEELRLRLAVVRAIGRVVRDENIAILCIGELVAGGWLASACQRLFKLKTVIYVHGEEISTRTGYDEDGSRRHRALTKADGVVAVSRFTRQTVMDSFGIPEQKIELVSNGVDLGRFTPGKKPPQLLQRYGLMDRPTLLTVSRLYARKGIDAVIEALPYVRKELPDLVYLVVGEGSFRTTLEELVARNDLSENVIFAGAVSDTELADHYRVGDVFIMPNREMPDGDTEGFGLVFLEANASGLPVIAGCAGGSVDAVTDQLNGLVVDGTDIQQVADAIIRLFRDRDLRANLISGGREVALASGWDRRVVQFLKFCDKLAASDAPDVRPSQMT